jgi:hypothetical protein
MRSVRCCHQIESLHGPSRAGAARDKVVNRIIREPTIGVDHYDDGRGIFFEVPKTKVQSVSLANPIGIVTLHDVGPEFSRGCGSIVDAIVRHNQ